jgi:chemotaxis-related protein WspD
VNPSAPDPAQLQPVNGSPAAPATNEDPALRTCWSEIGVLGNGTCRELQRYTHCRNCPVYANAAVQLLDRPLLPQYRREWSDHFAKPRKLAAPAKSSALVFRINSEWLALPTQAFQEVAENRLVHSLPHRREGIVLGLVNVRGELLICVALDRLLGLESAAASPPARRGYDRLLVTNWDGNRLVFPADEVRGIHRFHSDELLDLPGTVAKSEFTYTLGLLHWQGRSIGFLDAERLFATVNRNLA